MNKMPPRKKSDKYTKSAKWQDCQLRLPVCNGNPETVIFAHISNGAIGLKASNIHGAYCCSSCHDALDGRTQIGYSKDQLHYEHLKAVVRTQELMLRDGILVL